MKFRIYSGEIKRMMKTAIKCVETKGQSRNSNIHIRHLDNLLTIRATNGAFACEISTPMMGGDGEGFYVDGAMFGKVTGITNGEIEIGEDGKACVIKGAGRTRIPVIDAEIPEFAPVEGKTVAMKAETFRKMWESVGYAVATDQSRIVLTGVLMESEENLLRWVALDGFRMAVDHCACPGIEEIKAVVPGAFLDLVAGAIGDGEEVRLTFGEGRLQAETDSMKLQCGLLLGDYPDWKRILPTQFRTEIRMKTAELREALKNGSVISARNNLIRMKIGESEITLEGKSEEADYSAQISCQTQGDGMTIAFNQKYLSEMVNRIVEDDFVMSFNSSTSPCVGRGDGEENINLILPVRT